MLYSSYYSSQSGTDTNETDYNSILDLWTKELGGEYIEKTSDSPISQDQPQWYSKAYNYWESANNCPISGPVSI